MTVNRTLENQVYDLKREVKQLHEQLFQLETYYKRALTLEKFNLMRVKNGEELSDEFIAKGMGYLDLSPEKSFEIYNDKDRDFILLDVSIDGFEPHEELPEVKKIPLEELERNLHKIPAKHKSIMVISEDGVRSILACKLLNQHEYFNLNNISGGYKFWPGYRLQTITPTPQEEEFSEEKFA